MLAHFRRSSIRFFPEFRIVNTLYGSVSSRFCVARSTSAQGLNRMANQRFQKRLARTRPIRVFTLPRNRERSRLPQASNYV